jgi:hypothetical protein
MALHREVLDGIVARDPARARIGMNLLVDSWAEDSLRILQALAADPPAGTAVAPAAPATPAAPEASVARVTPTAS